MHSFTSFDPPTFSQDPAARDDLVFEGETSTQNAGVASPAPSTEIVRKAIGEKMTKKNPESRHYRRGTSFGDQVDVVDRDISVEDHGNTSFCSNQYVSTHKRILPFSALSSPKYSGSDRL